MCRRVSGAQEERWKVDLGIELVVKEGLFFFCGGCRADLLCVLMMEKSVDFCGVRF